MLAIRAHAHLCEILLDTDLAPTPAICAAILAVADHRPLQRVRHLDDRLTRVVHGLTIGREAARLGLGPVSVDRARVGRLVP